MVSFLNASVSQSESPFINTPAFPINNPGRCVVIFTMVLFLLFDTVISVIEVPYPSHDKKNMH